MRSALAQATFGLEPDDSRRCSFSELTANSCRYPIGEPRSTDFRYCGHDRANDATPYCDYHHRLCYRPVPR